MKKFSLFIIIDFAFKFLLLFTINLIWTLYFIRTPWLCILLSIIFAITIIFLFKFLNNKKHAKNKIKITEQKKAEAIKNTFIYMPQKDVLHFFCNLAKTKHEVLLKKNYILVNKQTVLYPFIKNQNLTVDKIIDIYNTIDGTNIKKIIILCNKLENNAEIVIENFETQTIVLDFKQTYTLLLKEYNFYPTITIEEKTKTKTTFKQLLKIAFNKKRTRGYIVSSLFIIFSSFFVAYRIYYLIVATVLLIFALLCQFEFKFNKIEQESLF